MAIQTYVPNPPPVDPKDIPGYLTNELLRIQESLEILYNAEFRIYYSSPPRPQHGQTVLADGVQWNPGSGRGKYWYDSITQTWKFLG